LTRKFDSELNKRLDPLRDLVGYELANLFILVSHGFPSLVALIFSFLKPLHQIIDVCPVIIVFVELRTVSWTLFPLLVSVPGLDFNSSELQFDDLLQLVVGETLSIGEPIDIISLD